MAKEVLTYRLLHNFDFTYLSINIKDINADNQNGMLIAVDSASGHDADYTCHRSKCLSMMTTNYSLVRLSRKIISTPWDLGSVRYFSVGLESIGWLSKPTTKNYVCLHTLSK
jgi:hypothetical protein